MVKIDYVTSCPRPKWIVQFHEVLKANVTKLKTFKKTQLKSIPPICSRLVNSLVTVKWWPSWISGSPELQETQYYSNEQ